jgi:anti-sigma factor RsiW
MERSRHLCADDLSAFALGVLDVKELSIVAEHLVSCARCHTIARSYTAVVALLALAAPQVEPSPDFRQRILSYPR